MAIKFGTDGTIYCNTVRYNYKQARNMIADGSYGNISGTEVWANVVASTNPAGYKSHRSFKIAPNATLQQSLPTLINNHKYYYSARVYSDGALNGAIRLRDSSGNVLSAIYLGSNYTSHTLVSNSFTPTYDITSGNIYCVNYNNNAYLSKFIMVDLTDTFGSGNEPSKEWCDNNIREQETICNKGNVSNNVTYSNFTTRYTGSNLNKADYNYLRLDSNWEPRDYMYYLRGLSDYTEGYLNSASAFKLNNTNTYYAYVEQYTSQVYGVTQSNDFYFPVAEPPIGKITLVDETKFNGGGGMRDWKRVSAFNTRTSFSNGSYNSRFDFNNMKQTNGQRLTAFNIINVATNITQYNNYNSTSITINDVNKEWCDRWIDGRSSPIIHIKNPANTSIKFNAPMQEMKKSSTPSYTKSQVDSYCGLKNDTWGEIVNANELHTGYAYINFILSDTNQHCRFLVSVKSVSGSTVTTDNYSWGAPGSDVYELANGYDIVCNDIEIRPELNKVIFDGNTGTIKCKMLVRTQAY